MDTFYRYYYDTFIYLRFLRQSESARKNKNDRTCPHRCAALGILRLTLGTGTVPYKTLPQIRRVWETNGFVAVSDKATRARSECISRFCWIDSLGSKAFFHHFLTLPCSFSVLVGDYPRPA